jgi:hypothetical protein
MNLLKRMFNNHKKVTVFKNINSEAAITKVVAMNTISHENSDHFTLDDPTQISIALKKWAFEPIDNIGRCGYDYTLFFYSDNTLINHSSLCFRCNRLAFQDKIYKISQNEILQLLNNDFTPVYKHIKKFNNIQEGRNFWKKLKDQSEIIFIKKNQPLWLKYDGKFEVNFSSNDSSRKNAKSYLHDSLQKFSDNKEHKLRFASQKESEKKFSYRYYVYGSKKLYDNIEGLTKNNWKELQNLEIELLYKNKPE